MTSPIWGSQPIQPSSFYDIKQKNDRPLIRPRELKRYYEKTESETEEDRCVTIGMQRVRMWMRTGREFFKEHGFERGQW